MRRQLLPLLAALALVGAACSETPETVVALGETPTEQAPETTLDSDGEGSDASSSSVSLDLDDPAVPEPATTTVPSDIDEPLVADEPPIMPVVPGDDWQDKPLAQTVLTEADLAALGVAGDIEAGYVGWIEVDDSNRSSDEICGEAVPEETSNLSGYFGFDANVILSFIVMPATDDLSVGPAYLAAFDRLATCPEPEDQYATVSVEIVDIQVGGADESIVIAGVDGDPNDGDLNSSDLNSGAEGLTVAGAVVDGHLFLASVSRPNDVPTVSDAELVVAALELSISRL